jgi:hypothetical protein
MVDLILVTDAMQFHLMHHIGLARAYPHIPYQYVVERYLIPAFDFHGVGTACRCGRNPDKPVAVVICSCPVRMSVESQTDPFPFGCPAPDIERNIPLKDHAVPDKTGQPDLGRRENTEEQAQDCGHGRTANGRSYFHVISFYFSCSSSTVTE